MCCSKAMYTTEWLQKKFKGKKKLRLWKRFNDYGQTVSRRVPYSYGTTTDKRAPKDFDHYNINKPRGIHVYLKNRRRCFPVWVKAKDLICAGDGQAVFKAIHICKKDWVKRFRPMTPTEKLLAKWYEYFKVNSNWVAKRSVRLQQAKQALRSIIDSTTATPAAHKLYEKLQKDKKGK